MDYAKQITTIPENESLKSFVEANERLINIFEYTKEILTYWKGTATNKEFSISDNLGRISIYIIGNKRAGSKHDMEAWKTTPLFTCKVERYSNSNDYYLDLEYNFIDPSKTWTQSWWRMSGYQIRSLVEESMNRAYIDFIESPINLI